MKIRIENIGAIRTAEVDLDKIAIIAGLNNTGKSTVGKSLLAFIRSLYRLTPERISRMRVSTMFNEVTAMVEVLTFPDKDDNAAPFLAPEWEPLQRFSKMLRESLRQGSLGELTNAREIAMQCFSELDEALPYVSKDSIQQLIDKAAAKIVQVANLPAKTIITNRISKSFRSLFRNQITPLMDNEATGLFRLEFGDKIVEAGFRDNACESYIQDTAVQNDIVAIIDNIESDLRTNLQRHLFLKRHSNSDTSSEDDTIDHDDTLSDDLREASRQELLAAINEIIPGTFGRSKERIFYKDTDTGAELNVRNLSDGMKSLAILKTLIETNVREGDIILLDEPEVHLHIAWQLKYAELIVMMQQKLNVPILLTTHSPFFVEAINNYADYYGMREGVHFHMSEPAGNGMFNISNIHGDVDKLYEQMFNPVSVLKEMRTMPDLEQ